MHEDLLAKKCSTLTEAVAAGGGGVTSSIDATGGFALADRSMTGGLPEYSMSNLTAQKSTIERASLAFQFAYKSSNL
jgi:hypothetical protein